ncbi:MAG: hypothetical protein KAU52_08115 [Methanosarcinales archaeon]|nr:hypothetical protein [Methanosarcinales archaeon]
MAGDIFGLSRVLQSVEHLGKFDERRKDARYTDCHTDGSHSLIALPHPLVQVLPPIVGDVELLVPNQPTALEQLCNNLINHLLSMGRLGKSQL